MAYTIENFKNDARIISSMLYRIDLKTNAINENIETPEAYKDIIAHVYEDVYLLEQSIERRYLEKNSKREDFLK